MRTYQMIDVYRNAPSFYTPDQGLVDEILAAAKKMVPTAETSSFDDLGFCRLHKLQKRDFEIAQWLHSWLCQNGFEPYAAYSWGSLAIHCFRREIEK